MPQWQKRVPVIIVPGLILYGLGILAFGQSNELAFFSASVAWFTLGLLLRGGLMPRLGWPEIAWILANAFVFAASNPLPELREHRGDSFEGFVMWILAMSAITTVPLLLALAISNSVIRRERANGHARIAQ